MSIYKNLTHGQLGSQINNTDFINKSLSNNHNVNNMIPSLSVSLLLQTHIQSSVHTPSSFLLLHVTERTAHVLSDEHLQMSNEKESKIILAVQRYKPSMGGYEGEKIAIVTLKQTNDYSCNNQGTYNILNHKRSIPYQTP